MVLYGCGQNRITTLHTLREHMVKISTLYDRSDDHEKFYYEMFGSTDREMP